MGGIGRADPLRKKRRTPMSPAPRMPQCPARPLMMKGAQNPALLYRLDAVILFRDLLLRGGEEAFAEHIGVHVDQDLVLGANAGSHIDIVSTVPLRARGVFAECLEDVAEITLLRFSLDDVLGVFAQTRSEGIAIGESPGSETTGSALGDDGCFNFLQDGGEIARFLGEVESESPWIAHEGRGKVGFHKDAAVREKLLEKRLGMGIVRAEERGGPCRISRSTGELSRG